MRTVIGVMGSGHPLDTAACARAYRLGAAIAEQNWVLLTGGIKSGVMDAASQGAKEAGGLVIGVLPGPDTREASAHLDIAIRTGMGDARNVINVLSSDAVIALPGGAGTISEVAHGLKSGKTVVALGWNPGQALLTCGPGQLHCADTIEQALNIVARSIPAM